MKNTTTTQCKSGKYSGGIAILVISTIFLSCTAYFNTFYNAEEAFKEGFRIHEGIMRNHPDSLVVKPTSEISLKYDRAIEKANKTIETFQKNDKWHDDALFLMGKAYYYKMEMDRALFRFRQLEREFPDSRYISEAQLFIAKSYIGNENYDKAEEVLITAEKRFPGLNKNHQITLLMITIAIHRNGKSQAIALLEETLKTIKSDKLRLDLYLRTAELYIELKQYQKAIVLLKGAPRRKGFPVQLYRIDKALFTCYKSLDSLELALNKIDVMLHDKRYTPFTDELLYLKALLVLSLGDVEESIKIFRRLTAGVDSNTVFSDTSSYKAKALLELAMIYQKQNEDYNKSYSYFKLASLSRDTGAQRTAKNYLSAMDRLNALRDSIDIPDSTHGGRVFEIGELFRFDLKESDSAYIQFISLCKDSTTDSSYIPKAMLQAAIIARSELLKSDLGDSIFKELIVRFPASEYAKSAQEELGIPVTVETQADSAEKLYRKAELLFYSENNVKGAIKLFYNIAKEYPDLSIAPKSLFAAAWLTSSVLYKKVTSKNIYDKICKEYPESFYCTDIAKPKIKVVVDTLAKLDQIRRKKMKDTKKHNNKNKASKKQIKSPDTGTQNTDNNEEDSTNNEEDSTNNEELLQQNSNTENPENSSSDHDEGVQIPHSENK